MNGYFWFVLTAVVGFYCLDVVSRWLNLSALQSEVPADFADQFDEAEYSRSQEYLRAKSRSGMVEDSCTLVIFLAFWLGGGFGWLDEAVRGMVAGELVRGLLYVGVLFLAGQLIRLPFDAYDTFVLEERFGFNRTSPAIFAGDRVKVLLLAAALGAPLLALVIFLFQTFGQQAWLYGWWAVTLFSLAMAYVAPQVILPLFHKFKPLPEGALKSAIEQMARQCQFPLTGIYEIDGSRRSTKSNAFFTGLGKNKKIALYDTLIAHHQVGELVAVLAHEIGHYKKRHIVQSLGLSILQMGILFYMLGWFLENRGLFDAFGVSELSIYGSLVFFTFLFEPVGKLLSVGMMVLSRRNEFQADAYAAEVTGRPDELIRGLKRLSKDNLTNLTPHPFYVFMNYSHPPMLQRIAALQRLAVTRG